MDVLIVERDQIVPPHCMLPSVFHLLFHWDIARNQEACRGREIFVLLTAAGGTNRRLFSFGHIKCSEIGASLVTLGTCGFAVIPNVYLALGLRFAALECHIEFVVFDMAVL